MSDATSDPGTMLKLGFIVLCVGGCALGMLALRQAGLQAGHELAQTQLRIQKADEDLWKLRAEISTLASPGRIRELADKLGPLHGLTPKPNEGGTTEEISTANGPTIATVAQTGRPKGDNKPQPKATPKDTARPSPKVEGKPESKPAATPVKPPAGSSNSPTTKPTSIPRRNPATSPTHTPTASNIT
jgi:cell division protein FtsL